MSDLFFEIMQLQPNETEFLSAVKQSNSKETAYKLGFMHGRSYAAQMGDEYAYRNAKKRERLVAALRNMVSAEDCSRDAPGILFDAAEEARAILAELENHP